MPFFQGDDQWTQNPKAKSLLNRAMTGDMTGVAAVGLWFSSGTACQASLTDGLVSFEDATRILLNPSMAAELAHLLVDAGLWHAPGHACTVCPPVPDTHWRFHDWFQMGYDTAAGHKLSRRKRQELKDQKLDDQVWARDCLDPSDPTTGACRYCGRVLKRATTRGGPTSTRWHKDHVDPARAEGIRNVVLACGECNQRKGKRTPAQAGMTLRPAPRPTADDPLALAVSPPQGAAETPQGAGGPSTPTRAPFAVSPPQGAAETLLDEPVAERVAVGADGHEQTPDRTGDQTTDQTTDQTGTGGGVLARTRAGARGCTRQAGSGDGVQSGTTGEPQGEAGQPAGRRRRRRRGRGGTHPDHVENPPTSPDLAPAAAPRWDAGDAPPVPDVGRFGSPWHGWRAPPPDDDLLAASTCDVHGLPEPCRRCAAAAAEENLR